ncbi:hypothetical protein PV04_03578 [Phialophora macrospora]|uniref:SET domain-containing protein n=1 Tax=Phialophora macrospora TaxID=1851006 RepID=A0A0D2GGL5_9EURO|nr:hypothetical protein PV04_03578 [Phialophora macrospora]
MKSRIILGIRFCNITPSEFTPDGAGKRANWPSACQTHRLHALSPYRLPLLVDSYWPSASGRSMTQALALGLGSMFNHSTRNQNVGWIRNTETDVIVYTALRDIEAGEELCISYGSARLWFPDADAQVNPSEGLGDDDNDIGGETLAELDMSGLSKMDL